MLQVPAKHGWRTFAKPLFVSTLRVYRIDEERAPQGDSG
jgi:hypothetical protein